MIEHQNYVTFQCTICGFDQGDSTKILTYFQMQQHVMQKHFKIQTDLPSLEDFQEVWHRWNTPGQWVGLATDYGA